MNWTYNDKEIKSHDDLPSECCFFIYEIFYTDGTSYIGQKKIKTTKEELPLKNGKKRDGHICYRNRIKNHKRVEVEVFGKNRPFINYAGSCKDGIKRTIAKKVMLYLTSNKTTATYLEVRELMERRALETDLINNKNINSKWYDNCLDGLI